MFEVVAEVQRLIWFVLAEGIAETAQRMMAAALFVENKKQVGSWP